MENKIPEGYKQTKLGVIPKSWSVVPLNKIVTKHKAGIYKKAELYGQGENIVGVGDLYRHTKIDGQVFRRVPLSKEEINKFQLEYGDILYVDSSLVRSGIAKTIPVTKGGAGTIFAWHTRKVSLDLLRVNPFFISSALELPIVRMFIEGVATQTALTGITVKDYLSSPIPLPPLAEQEKIASILSSVDDAIQAREAVLAQTKVVKKGLLQDLLTKGIGHTEFKDSKLGRIPKSWEVKQLKSIIKELKAGVSVNSENRTCLNGEFGILKTSSVSSGVFLPTEHKTILQDEIGRAIIKVKKNTIIISRMNTTLLVGASVFVEEDFNHLFVPDRLWVTVFKDSKSINVKWLSLVLGSYPFRKMLQYRSSGTSAGMKNISKSDLLTMNVAFPPLAEQQKIAEILTSVDDQIQAHESAIEQLKQTKAGLLQDLLTGKVRVSV